MWSGGLITGHSTAARILGKQVFFKSIDDCFEGSDDLQACSFSEGTPDIVANCQKSATFLTFNVLKVLGSMIRRKTRGVVTRFVVLPKNLFSRCYKVC